MLNISAGETNEALVNLGKWVLRNLFSSLIQEEIKRDREYHRGFLESLKHRYSGKSGRSYGTPRSPTKTLSQGHYNGDYLSHQGQGSRPLNGASQVPATPGITIGAAPETPGPAKHEDITGNQARGTERRTSQQGLFRPSMDRRSGSYRDDPNPRLSSEGHNGRISTDGPPPESNPQSPTSPEKEEKKEGSFSFGSKFRTKISKKLGRSSVETKPSVVEEKPEDMENTEVFHDEKSIEDNFYGTLQKIRYGFEDRVESEPSLAGDPRIQPSPPNESLEIRLPPSTAIIIQEDRLDAGGVVDVYRGTVASVGRDADLIERNAPMWLGDLLLLVGANFNYPLHRLLT